MSIKNMLSRLACNEKPVSWFAWCIVLSAIIISLTKYHITNREMFGDEGTYRNEVAYLAKYGFYKGLAQGTSMVYSSLVFVFSTIFHTEYLVSQRLLTFIFYLVSCRLLVKCLEQFHGIGYKERYMTLAFFAAVSLSWLKEGLPDMIDVSCMLGAIYVVLRWKGYGSAALAGFIVFLGFAVKPVVLFVIPGIWVVLVLKDRTWGKNIRKAALFTAVFVACFVLYHIPGYQTYHRLMLEDKDHYYEANGVRVQNTTTWPERNMYFELYNPNKRPTQWYVTWEEVDSFKRLHPDIKLALSPTDVMLHHTSAWINRLGTKVFVFFPYNVQRGFFFFWWTQVNRFVKSIAVIAVLTSLLIFGLYFLERKFIWQNALLLSIPVLYYAELSFYVIIPLQGNWLLFCMPFFALPISKFLVKYVNIIVLLALQLVFMLTTYNSI